MLVFGWVIVHLISYKMLQQRVANVYGLEAATREGKTHKI
jgi:hypothetical protein